MIKLPDNVLRFVLSAVLRPFAPTAVLAAGFGAAVRVLTVVSFVLILQALFVAALPEIGGGRLVSLQTALSRLFPAVASMSLTVLSIALVLFAHAMLLGCYLCYQKLLGRLIARAGARLTCRLDLVGKEDVLARQLISTVAINSVRVLEVALFMALMFLLIATYNIRIALILGVGCAAALVIIILTRKSSVVDAREVEELRKAHIHSRERESSEARAHRNAEEKLRYRKGMAPGWDNAVLGLVVSAVIVLLLTFHAGVSEHPVHAVILVLAMRFAVAYTRDLAKALSALFDLRVNPTFREIALPRSRKAGKRRQKLPKSSI